MPLKLTVLPTVVLVIATVAALTVLLKVVPPEFVIVIVPMSVPTAPTVTAPVVLIVKFDALPPAVPVTDDKLKVLAMPVPTVKVTPSARVAAPKVIAPVEVPPTVLL